jgi:hypothetical protein
MKILKPVLLVSACVATAALLVSCTNSQPVNLLVNPGFEELTEKQKPVAWRTSQHAGKTAYKYEIDSEVVFDEMHSYRIEQHIDQAYGMVQQSVVLPDKESKTFLFTAMMKTKDVAAGRGWLVSLTCKNGNNSILKQFQSEPMIGTTDWQKVTLEGDIPKGTVKFSVGILLGSLGTGWVDDTSLSVN